MKSTSTALLIGAALVIGANGSSVAADKKTTADYGQREFRNSCALCHAQDGKGGSQILDLLKKAPPDLTTLARRNGGVFPSERVYAMIDGREMIRAHGARDMPAWGERYTTDTTMAAEYYMDMPYSMEMYARSRILALVDYLHRMQVK